MGNIECTFFAEFTDLGRVDVAQAEGGWNLCQRRKMATPWLTHLTKHLVAPCPGWPLVRDSCWVLADNVLRIAFRAGLNEESLVGVVGWN